MKRYLAIFGFVFIGVVAGLLVRGIPIVLQVNAGGGIQADRNGDVNGDARLDMSDAVYLLLHIFRDGPQPVALAQGEPVDLRGLEEPINRIADALERQDDIECNLSSLDRFVWQEDGTVIDTCKRLMWLDKSIQCGGGQNQTCNYFDAVVSAENLEHAGYSDWRLPTISELSGLVGTSGNNNWRMRIPFAGGGSSSRMWSSTRSERDGWQYHFYQPNGQSCSGAARIVVTRLAERTYCNGSGFGFLPVRDISPNE